MIYKKDLTALKKEVTAIGKKVENLLKAHEKDVKAKPTKKAPLKRRTSKLSATDKVLRIINRSKKGVDASTLKKNTGFDDKKLRNIIFQANKEGKIQRVGRGLYIGVKTEAPEVSEAKAAKARLAKKAPVKKRATKTTATDKILEIVKTSKNGVDIAIIKKKTGFDDKKVRNIVFRAYKEGKIKRTGRGVYSGA
jgi:predicted transcriptional regulator of viral defense system